MGMVEQERPQESGFSAQAWHNFCPNWISRVNEQDYRLLLVILGAEILFSSPVRACLQIADQRSL